MIFHILSPYKIFYLQIIIRICRTQAAVPSCLHRAGTAKYILRQVGFIAVERPKTDEQQRDYKLTVKPSSNTRNVLRWQNASNNDISSCFLCGVGSPTTERMCTAKQPALFIPDRSRNTVLKDFFASFDLHLHGLSGSRKVQLAQCVQIAFVVIGPKIHLGFLGVLASCQSQPSRTVSTSCK